MKILAEIAALVLQAPGFFGLLYCLFMFIIDTYTAGIRSSWQFGVGTVVSLAAIWTGDYLKKVAKVEDSIS